MVVSSMLNETNPKDSPGKRNVLVIHLKLPLPRRTKYGHDPTHPSVHPSISLIFVQVKALFTAFVFLRPSFSPITNHPSPILLPQCPTPTSAQNSSPLSEVLRQMTSPPFTLSGVYPKPPTTQPCQV